MRTFLIILVLFPIFLCAQNDTLKRVVFEDEFRKSFRTKPKLDVKFDNRFSFIRDSDVKTVGIKVGLSFNRKFKVGLGLNSLVLPSKENIQVADETVLAELNYSYFSPYIEYVYHNSKRWELSLSLQHGIGGASFNYRDDEGVLQKFNQTTILTYEPAMLIDYKIIRWFGIGTGVGYRLVYYKSKGIDQKFSSPEYILKLKIYLGEIVRTITGKDLEID